VKLRRVLAVLAVAWALSSSSVDAQQNDAAATEAAEDKIAADDGQALATIAAVLAQGLAIPGIVTRSDETIEILRNVLESPQTESRLLNTYLEGDHGWQFLRDVNFKFKAFEADAADDAALGFSYDYQKSVQSHALACSAKACAQGLDLSLSAVGNVAFDSERNPNDFLETALSFAFFRSVGGVSQLSDRAFTQVQQLRAAFVAAKTADSEEAIIRQLQELVRPALTDQFYWEAASDISLESDQNFDRKQLVYGVHALLEVKGWSDDSAFAKFNLLDYPFAALRAFTGYESCSGGGSACFVPRGTSLPTVLVGIARVSPQDNDPRALVGEAADFDRLRIEASFRTPIARAGEDRLYISANYRYYKELDASAAVRSLGLDSFDYYTVVLGGSEGVYVSYTEGKLPLDVISDRVFELGYQFNLR
jgi:hypothetical protein